ncbi:hypothetical protein [Reticulibacter mediterranei]|nr:hypothetical protein [Reticulibacter mediterranei]
MTQEHHRLLPSHVWHQHFDQDHPKHQALFTSQTDKAEEDVERTGGSFPC